MACGVSTHGTRLMEFPHTESGLCGTSTNGVWNFHTWDPAYARPPFGGRTRSAKKPGKNRLFSAKLISIVSFPSSNRTYDSPKIRNQVAKSDPPGHIWNHSQPKNDPTNTHFFQFCFGSSYTNAVSRYTYQQ